MYTIVSHIYAPRFALVKSVGGAYLQDLTFYLANTTPLSGQCLDVDIGILQLQTITELEAGSTPIGLRFSCPPETRWSRVTDKA